MFTHTHTHTRHFIIIIVHARARTRGRSLRRRRRRLAPRPLDAPRSLLPGKPTHRGGDRIIRPRDERVYCFLFILIFRKKKYIYTNWKTIPALRTYVACAVTRNSTFTRPASLSAIAFESNYYFVEFDDRSAEQCTCGVLLRFMCRTVRVRRQSDDDIPLTQWADDTREEIDGFYVRNVLEYASAEGWKPRHLQQITYVNRTYVRPCRRRDWNGAVRNRPNIKA